MKIRDITDYLSSISIPIELVGDNEQEIVGYSSLYRCKPGTVVWARDRATFLGRNKDIELSDVQLFSYSV